MLTGWIRPYEQREDSLFHWSICVNAFWTLFLTKYLLMVNAKWFKGPSMGRMRCTRMMLLFLGPVIKKACLEWNIHLIDYYQLKPSKCIC